MAEGNEHRVYGPPGTGKTTYLSKLIGEACRTFGSNGVLVASFTKAAAHELVGRRLPIDPSRVGTLHSFCYRLLAFPPIVESAKWFTKWNESVPPQHKLSGIGKSLDDPYAEGGPVGAPGDEKLHEYNLLRSSLLEGIPDHLVAFVTSWETFKTKNELADFTDLIWRAYRDHEKPPYEVAVGFFDEAQDFTPLELALVRKWGSTMSRFVLAGDDDQCQPPGTLVTIEGGSQIPIEQLREGQHRLVCYDRRGATTVGWRKGFDFKKSQNRYRGSLFTVSVGDKETRATRHHRWLIRFTAGAKKLQVTYLMRRGNWWRVGRCKLFRADGVLHLGIRARLENADAAWILSAHDTKRGVWRDEQRVASDFGIPQLCFKISRDAKWLSQDDHDEFFDLLSSGDLPNRAMKLLCSRRLDFRFPLWSKKRAYERRGGSSLMIVETANLLPGYMEMPIVADGKHVSWEPFTMEVREYDGPVYSIDVKPHELYLADGIVTHNTIYTFRGAIPEAFLDPPIPEDRKVLLPRSWRLPRLIQSFSQQWIRKVSRREEKPFEPNDEEGEILTRGINYRMGYEVVATAVEEEGSVMILTTCGFMLHSILKKLRQNGVPFHNPYRPAKGAWNPMRGGGRRMISFLRTDEELFGDQARYHSWLEVWDWLEFIDAKSLGLKHGSKVLVKQLAEEEKEDANLKTILTEDDYREVLGIDCPPPDPDWLLRFLLKTKVEMFEYAVQVIKKRGAKALLEKPKIIIGTIHSVKGGEASSVILFPDMSPSALAEESSGQVGRDAMRRVFYVGMTRARKRLILCEAYSEACAAPIPSPHAMSL